MIGVVGIVAACNPQVPEGQYGSYDRRPGHLILESGDTLTVYRVKYWTFASGDPPALQLEYEAPFSVSDTLAVHQEVRLLWPDFAPYVEAQNLTAAIITATNLRIAGVWPLAWHSQARSNGVGATRGPDGHWRIAKDTSPLPAADRSGSPHIIDIDGKPLPFHVMHAVRAPT
jgi:hypothetical protein